MSKTRRTNPGFLSNNEAARERKRIQDFVKHINEIEKLENQNQTNDIKNKDKLEKNIEKISITSEFWNTKKGLIVQAIVLNRAYNKEAILRVTHLKDEEYREAATELFQAGLLLPYGKISGNLSVTRELYCQCKQFFKQSSL
jgi:hypothetical protein